MRNRSSHRLSQREIERSNSKVNYLKAHKDQRARFEINVGAYILLQDISDQFSLSPSTYRFTSLLILELQMLTLLLNIYLELVQYQIPLHLKVKNLNNLSYLDVFPLDPIE